MDKSVKNFFKKNPGNTSTGTITFEPRMFWSNSHGHET